MTIDFARVDIMDTIILLVAIGLLGHALARSTKCMQEKTHIVVQRAKWLSVVTGLAGVVVVGRENVGHSGQLLSMIMTGSTLGFLVYPVWYLLIGFMLFAWEHLLFLPRRSVGVCVSAIRNRQLARRMLPKIETNPQPAAVARRKAARYDCHAFYETHPEVAKSFPSDRFDQFVKTFLSDNESSEIVEQRAEDLIGRMSSMLAVGSESKWSDEDVIAEHFTEAMNRYRHSGLYNEEELESLQTDLRVEMHEELTKFRNKKAS